jgi:hypothetical protein
MDKAITVSKTYRVTMTADEHRGVRVYCANHDTKASELIAKFLKRLIKRETDGQPDSNTRAIEAPQQTPARD